MRTLIIALLLMSTAAVAEVSRQDAEKIIDEMVRTHQISKEEADKARVRLHSMTSEEWTKLNQQAEEKVAQESANRAPASVDVADPATTDLNEEQLSAIQSDLETISPYKIRPYKQPPIPITVVNPVVVEEVKVAPVVVDPVVVEDVKVDPVVVNPVVVHPTIVEPTVVPETQIQ